MVKVKRVDKEEILLKVGERVYTIYWEWTDYEEGEIQLWDENDHAHTIAKEVELPQRVPVTLKDYVDE